MMQKLGEITLACIASAGGIGGIVIATIKFSSNMIAEKLSQKYEQKLEQKLERYKTELSKREYMSKTRFDTEFNLYRNLSQKFSQMVMEVITVISDDSYKEGEKIETTRLNTAVDYAKSAIDELYAAAPFIQKEIYDELLGVYEMCRKQCIVYSKISKHKNIDNEKYIEAITYNRKIQKEYNNLLEKIRDYTMKLDVID
ncbi:MAG: hypothetical protein J1E61_10595 [Lachnospiraceae bacterium]|nr:hypothetical protein [Lachnospiraceae bacterium]